MICYVHFMEKILALIFSFVVFVIGLAFLITGRLAIGLLLFAVFLLLVFLAFRKKETVIVEQRIDIGGQVNSRILKCRNCGAELDKEAMTVKLGAVFISCPYCHSQYQLEEEPKW
jgi:Zn finger protein HypA/HybF involved in hydrogenase expression